MCFLGSSAAAQGQVALGGDAVWAPVLRVTHETLTRTEKQDVCWESLVSDRERARRQYDSQPWVVKYWKPILGGVLGGLVGYRFTANYGVDSQKWVYPTVAAGVGAGAMTGPGFVAGAYGLGTLAYAYWPGKLPLVAALSLVGGLLGDSLLDLLFPDSPPKSLLETPAPGQYLADQRFFVETTCVPRYRSRVVESPYRVTYEYQGQQRSGLVRHYPGERIRLDAAGRPLGELPAP